MRVVSVDMQMKLNRKNFTTGLRIKQRGIKELGGVFFDDEYPKGYKFRVAFAKRVFGVADPASKNLL